MNQQPATYLLANSIEDRTPFGSLSHFNLAFR